MHEMPLQDESREQSKTHSSSLPQHHHRTTASRLPCKIFHSDEHPEIPQIKRASRYRHAHPQDPNSRQQRQASQKVQVYQQKHQRKQSPISLLQFTARPKPVAIGNMALVVMLAILTVITISHQLSPQNTQAQTNRSHHPSRLHHIDANKSQDMTLTQHNDDHPVPPILATSAYLLDADSGTIIYASNPSMHLPMLSTTKLMTALVATQLGDFNQRILISDAIANDINQLLDDSSLMGIKRGETYTLKDLLYGMLLVSGNDAALAIADQLGGGNQQNFVDKMNQEAVKLGLHDTHFMNPHGLLATGHFSSAHDLALLAKYSLSVPSIYTISNSREYDIAQNDLHDGHTMLNENQFMWWYPGVDGGKPGWDAASDFVQVISCVRNHRHLIGAVMHTIDWWTDMRDLMNWGFHTFDWQSPYESNSSGNPIPFATAWHYFSMDKKEKTIPTVDKGRYYIYTGYSISNPIMTYFDKHGGLNAFGFPVAQAKILRDSILSQKFERSTILCNQKIQMCHSL
jgi:D-alanyl-D-alanine carboxypeptidase